MENLYNPTPFFYSNPLESITRIEYRGQLTLTTAQLALFYECNTKQLRQNFNNNRERFIEGKHFFKLEGDELTILKNCVENFDTVITPRTSSLYLWTKRGAARHAKMLSTDRAWEVFEKLEDTYFAQPLLDKDFVSVSDFERAKAISALASHSRDPVTKERLVAKAANLLKAEEFLQVPDKPTMQLSLFGKVNSPT